MIRLRIVGLPQTKGNKSAVRLPDGRMRVLEGRTPEARQRVQTWTTLVGEEIQRWCEANDFPVPLEGPVEVRMRFDLVRPASHPKTRRTWPIGKRSGDCEKYARLVADALTGPVLRDDAQIVRLGVSKDYRDPPGAIIEVEPLDATSDG